VFTVQAIRREMRRLSATASGRPLAPDNSMLDLVPDRRKGLPILLSAVYVEVARRAGVELSGVGLPGVGTLG